MALKIHITLKTTLIALVCLILVFAIGCSKSNGADNKVVIYTSSDENEITIIREMLDQKFPDYEINLEYLSTGNHAAKLKAEGINSECDISYDLEYGYMELLDKQNIFASLSEYDFSKYIDDLVVSDTYVPTLRYGGAIILHTKMLEEQGLALPTSYKDLLKPEYKNYISMPNPKASGTGYMFYKSLVNAWGEEETLQYFDQLAGNILQFTSSGSGPVNSLVQEEVAIALGMTSHAALKKSDGYPIEIRIFSEGSPFLACGAAIIKGKENRKAVQEVFTYFYEVITPVICTTLYPEQIYKDVIAQMENYPTDITYADMRNNTPTEKERLLELWKY